MWLKLALGVTIFECCIHFSLAGGVIALPLVVTWRKCRMKRQQSRDIWKIRVLTFMVVYTKPRCVCVCCFYKNSLTRTASFILHIKPSHIFMVCKSWFRNGHCNYITPDRQPQGRLSAWGGPQMDTLVWCVVSQAPCRGPEACGRTMKFILDPN